MKAQVTPLAEFPTSTGCALEAFFATIKAEIGVDHWPAPSTGTGRQIADRFRP